MITCVDRTSKTDDSEIPDIMRQEPHLQLPQFGHCIHTAICRDLKRNAELQRPDPEDCHRFLQAGPSCPPSPPI